MDCSVCRGRYPISRFLGKNKYYFQKELDNLKLVEATLDSLIKSCAQQLFDMTDDVENSAYPFTADHRSEAGLLYSSLTSTSGSSSGVLRPDLKKKSA